MIPRRSTATRKKTSKKSKTPRTPNSRLTMTGEMTTLPDFDALRRELEDLNREADAYYAEIQAKVTKAREEGNEVFVRVFLDALGGSDD